MRSVAARDKQIHPPDFVRQPLLNEEVQSTINRRRRGIRPIFFDLFEQIVGFDTFRAAIKQAQNLAPDRCQTRSTLFAGKFRAA